MSSSIFRRDKSKKIELRKFCFQLGVSRRVIESLLAKPNQKYHSWSKVKLDESKVVKTYLDGTPKLRIFNNPNALLKFIQSRIYKSLLLAFELPQCVHGGRKKRSNITNAAEHIGNCYRFQTDLKDFYPSVKPSMVYDALIGQGTNSHVAHWITKLCTNDAQLPQGSPTSQALSNIAFYSLDLKLTALCEEHGITYTRYIDDLTFSSRNDFKFLHETILLMLQEKFKISYRKTTYSSDETVTGIRIIGNRLEAPKHMIEKAEAEELSDAALKPYSKYIEKIKKIEALKRRT